MTLSALYTTQLNLRSLFERFPIKATNARSRRALDKFVKHKDITVKRALLPEQDERLKGIYAITDHNSLSKEYRVIKNGTVDWIIIMDDKKKKVQFPFSIVELLI